jgi:protein-S-isoprenylcysteine O-methyltransferase Ste14
MNQQPEPNTSAKVRTTQWRWQRVARRIRVPLGFLTAAVYLVEVVRRAPHPTAIAWSVLLVLPGLALRAAASGTVKKNQELTVTGPYAYTRNPLYLGSTLIAAGFAVALLSWPLALLLAAGFAAIYIPVIASEEQFLRTTFPEFDHYCRSVPRFIPRLTPAAPPRALSQPAVSQPVTQTATRGFSFALYLKHREYNSALGAALLYLSLVCLRPALMMLFGRTW